MLVLFPTILLMCGKVNFTNMSRYSSLSERTYRRQYGQTFPYMAMNRLLIEQAIPPEVTQIAVMDCVVGVGRSMHPQHPQGERVVLGERPQTVERGGDGNIGAACQLQ